MINLCSTFRHDVLQDVRIKYIHNTYILKLRNNYRSRVFVYASVADSNYLRKVESGKKTRFSLIMLIKYLSCANERRALCIKLDVVLAFRVKSFSLSAHSEIIGVLKKNDFSRIIHFRVYTTARMMHFTHNSLWQYKSLLRVFYLTVCNVTLTVKYKFLNKFHLLNNNVFDREVNIARIRTSQIEQIGFWRMLIVSAKVNWTLVAS